jgi:hypothetical protein
MLLLLLLLLLLLPPPPPSLRPHCQALLLHHCAPSLGHP